MSSAHGNAFLDIIDKVQANNTVQAIRSNLLISKLGNLQNSQVIL